MPVMTEKGTLPVGVEFDGKTCREFELREQLLRDSVDVFDSPDRLARAEKNDLFYGVCVLAGRVTIDGIPRDQTTPELLMDLSQEDYDELLAASGRLRERRASFRGAAQAAAQG